jgi:hypothetical protein
MDPDIIGHYSLGVEEERLTEGETSRIEFARTKEVRPPRRVVNTSCASLARSKQSPRSWARAATSSRSVARKGPGAPFT